MKSLGFYTEAEAFAHTTVESFPSDAERQAGFARIDERVRRRLRIPVNRYYSVTTEGELLLDEKRERPKPIKKISKSDQP